MKKIMSVMAAMAIVLSCSIMGIGTVAFAAEESPEADFMAFDGVLEEYIGPGGAVVIPASLGITEIAPSAFYKNKDITSIVIPEGVEVIGTRAFEYCENLEKVEFPYSLMEMQGNAFASTGLTEVLIPGQLDCVEAWTFSGCLALKKVEFSYGVKEIHLQAFCSLYTLGTVVFPETVELIAGGAFNCQQDTEATEYIICNPDCEIGLWNGTWDGNRQHKWESNEYHTPFQSSYGVVTYKIVVPENSAIEKFLNEKGDEMFATGDNTNHVDKGRVVPKSAEYFEKLEQNQKDFGITKTRTDIPNNDNPDAYTGNTDPDDVDKGTDKDTDKTTTTNKKDNKTDNTKADSNNSTVITLIIVIAAVVIVIIIAVVVVVVLFATGKLGGKKAPAPAAAQPAAAEQPEVAEQPATEDKTEE